MDITPKLAEGRQRITTYGGGKFTIAGQEYAHSIFLTSGSLHKLEMHEITQIDTDNLVDLLQGTECELLLIGTGKTQHWLRPAVSRRLRDAIGCGIEVMDTGAACRTYNVLLTEDRRVAALLIAV